jgi:hypothetical protein
MKIRTVRVDFLGDGRTDLTHLIVAFRNLQTRLKNAWSLRKSNEIQNVLDGQTVPAVSVTAGSLFAALTDW